jgi:hypothetical protein
MNFALPMPPFTVGPLSLDGKCQPLASGVLPWPRIDMMIISAKPAIAIFRQANVPFVTDWHFQSRDSDLTAQRDLYNFKINFLLIFIRPLAKYIPI